MKAHRIIEDSDWTGAQRASIGIDPGLTRSGVGIVVELDRNAGPTPDFGRSHSTKELNRQRLVTTGRRLRVQEAWTVGHAPLPRVEETAAPGCWRDAGTQPDWQRLALLLGWYRQWIYQRLKDHPDVEWSLVLETATATSLRINRDILGAFSGALVQVALQAGMPPDRVYTASGTSKYTSATYMLLGQMKPTKLPTKRKERKPFGVHMLLEHARLMGRELDLDSKRELHWDGADACLLALQAWSCHGTYDPPAAVRYELETRAGETLPGKRKRRAFRDDLPLTYQLW